MCSATDENERGRRTASAQRLPLRLTKGHPIIEKGVAQRILSITLDRAHNSRGVPSNYINPHHHRNLARCTHPQLRHRDEGHCSTFRSHDLKASAVGYLRSNHAARSRVHEFRGCQLTLMREKAVTQAAYLASDSTVHLPAPIMIVAVPSFMLVPANDKLLLSRSNS
jgi:hypothetical protein